MKPWREVFLDLEDELRRLEAHAPIYVQDESLTFARQRRELIRQALQKCAPHEQGRLQAEIETFGPLERLWSRTDLNEILVNGPEEIWIETRGQLERVDDAFASEQSYRNALERLCHEAGVQTNLERPCTDGRFRDFRLHFVRPPLTRQPLLSLRRHPANPWTLEKLVQAGWCSPDQAEYLRKLVQSRRNLMVVGPTGGGKTSILNALLQEVSHFERVGIIEDTDEIHCPAGPSYKLLTRFDAQGFLPEVDQSQLIKQSLRMRPDRLILGEVRGGEAKDFLMALSTGHAGSWGTLHAENPFQALIRLEMLIQLGAPQWNLEAIRRLIQFSLQELILTGRDRDGHRVLKGIFRLSSLEETGFILDPLPL